MEKTNICADSVSVAPRDQLYQQFTNTEVAMQEPEFLSYGEFHIPKR